jgi:hypothetical protein
MPGYSSERNAAPSIGNERNFLSKPFTKNEMVEKIYGVLYEQTPVLP